MPFTRSDFFGVFETYNLAIWPAQIVAYLLAVAALGAILVQGRWSGAVVRFALATMWAWTGAVYHLNYFAAINRAAYIFGAFFIVQALLFASPISGRHLLLKPRARHAVWAWALIVYALVVYPALGSWLGPDYPQTPSFGVTPCPLAIFTLGILLLNTQRTLWSIAAIPIVWSAVGGSAAFLLGVPQDLTLPIAGALFVYFNLRADG
jgi:uncharacterized protein DUF6064